jgi:hypothetical protein
MKFAISSKTCYIANQQLRAPAFGFGKFLHYGDKCFFWKFLEFLEYKNSKVAINLEKKSPNF